MSTDSKPPSPGSQKHARLYQSAFVKKCHHLIACAYATMDSPSCRASQETEITGELVKHIRQFLESSTAPAWSAHFFVADDPPQAAPGLLGKRRPRVDIEFERGQRGRRPRLHFEAKRLRTKSSVGEYLGTEGLMMFVNGTYAPEQDAGAMIGYVQAEEHPAWVERIGAALTSNATRYGFRLPPGLKPVNLVVSLDGMQLSFHDRTSVGRPIAIYHTFLRFCE